MITISIMRTFHADTAPTIVCLCGSTRFGEAFREANLRETLAGKIVLSIGCDTRTDADLVAAGELGQDVATAKATLGGGELPAADDEPTQPRILDGVDDPWEGQA